MGFLPFRTTNISRPFLQYQENKVSTAAAATADTELRLLNIQYLHITNICIMYILYVSVFRHKFIKIHSFTI